MAMAIIFMLSLKLKEARSLLSAGFAVLKVGPCGHCGSY